MRVDHFIHIVQDPETARFQSVVLRKLDKLIMMENLDMALSAEVQRKVDAARDAVRDLTSAEDSNRTLLDHMVQMIADLKANSTDEAVIAAIDELVAGINENKDKILADVAANTPGGSEPFPAADAGTPVETGVTDAGAPLQPDVAGEQENDETVKKEGEV